MTLELLPDTSVARWASVLVPAAQLAERIAGTEFVPAAMRGKPDVVVAAIMYGDELGIGPMQALASIHVVDGRPQPSAELCRALIARAGHSFVVHEMTGTRARVSGLRAGQPESQRTYVEWSLDMARAAGLLGKDNWRKYPRAMLLARATGDLARVAFPDVVKGMGYVAEDAPAELDAWAPAGSEPEPEPTPRRRVARRTRPAARALETATGGPDTVPSAPEPTDEPERPPVAPPSPPRPRDDGPDYAGYDGTDESLPDMPEPEPGPPEPPPEVNPHDDPRADPEPITPQSIAQGPLKAIHTKLGTVLGPNETREERLAIVGAIVGRELSSTNNLTRQEGYRVLDVLAAIQAGEATWETDEAGELRILDLRRPPDERDADA